MYLNKKEIIFNLCPPREAATSTIPISIGSGADISDGNPPTYRQMYIYDACKKRSSET